MWLSYLPCNKLFDQPFLVRCPLLHLTSMNSKQKVASYDCFKAKSVTNLSLCVSMVLMWTKIKSKWSYINQKFPAPVRNTLNILTSIYSFYNKFRDLKKPKFQAVNLQQSYGAHQPQHSQISIQRIFQSINNWNNLECKHQGFSKISTPRTIQGFIAQIPPWPWYTIRSQFSKSTTCKDINRDVHWWLSKASQLCSSHLLAGLVVKASASGSGRSQVQIPLATGFFQVESYQWLINWHSSGYPARRLALKGQRRDWSARCQYTVTGWGRKFDLQLLFQCGSTQNCLCRSVPEIH